jgi:uncharacterized protein
MREFDIAAFRRQLASHPRTRPVELCDLVECDGIERHFSILEVKACKSQDRTISGYGSTFGLPPDAYGDVIDPGAFRETVAHWNASEKKLPLLDGHVAEVRSIVGWMTRAVEDKIGLHCRFRIFDGEDGDAILKRVNSPVRPALSIGYLPLDTRSATEQERKAGAYRVLTKISLREISLVTWPANERAQIDIAMHHREPGRAGTPLWETDPSDLPLAARIELLRRRGLALQIESVLRKARGLP